MADPTRNREFRFMRSFRALTIAAILAGCSAGSGPSGAGFPEAYATRQCGPADGPSVAIYLTPSPEPHPEAPDGQPVPPFLRLTILHDVDQIAGHTFTWNASRPVEAERTSARPPARAPARRAVSSASRTWTRIAGRAGATTSSLAAGGCRARSSRHGGSVSSSAGDAARFNLTGRCKAHPVSPSYCVTCETNTARNRS